MLLANLVPFSCIIYFMKKDEIATNENFGIKHIAFILDGNGRWAKARKRPRNYGHARGFTSLFDVAIAVNNRNIEVMTVYAFSTENWNRPKKEVDYLFKTLEHRLTNTMKKVQKHGIKITTMGDLTRLPLSTQAAIKKAVDESANNERLILNICINYGGKDEIVRAIKKLSADVKESKVAINEIDETLFENYLDSQGLPPVDLMVRTSGEQRLSNFLLWQNAYAEFIFTPVLWPDYNEQTLADDLKTYAQRKRRFGGLNNE